MPKASPPDDKDLYAYWIDEQRSALAEIVSETKWIVELIALFVTDAAVFTCFIILVCKNITEGLSIGLVFATIAAAIGTYLLFDPTTKAANLAVTAVVFKLRSSLRIPADIQDRNICFRALWQAFLNGVLIGGIWGISVLITELVKHGAGAG